MSVISEILGALGDNAAEAVGVAVATVVTGAAGWVWRRVRRDRSDSPPLELTGPTSGATDYDIGAYLDDLVRRGSTLSFGDPAAWAADRPDDAGLVTLEQVWTPLRVADSWFRVGKTGTHESMAEEDAGTDLIALFRDAKDSLLLLGDPGSGKSTSMAYLAVQLARIWTGLDSGPLPIWVSLANVDVAAGDPSSVLLTGVSEIDIAATRAGPSASEVLKSRLRQKIGDGSSILLLDGLDEVKEPALAEVRSAISQILRGRRQPRVVVSCRKFDYRQSKPSRKLPIERELELLPFSKAEKNVYVDRWYDAAMRIGRFSRADADDLSASLKAELRNEALDEISGSPLLLALLTLIHSEEAKLPDTRAVVCDRAIKYMLADSAKWRKREAGSATTASPAVLSLAVEVAYRAHVAEGDAANGSTGVSLSVVRREAQRICDDMANAEIGRDLPTPDDLVRRLLFGHGLLLDSGGGRYEFAHRHFQEFLAGQHFAVGAHKSEAVKRGALDQWREPFRLMASLAGHDGENLYYIFSLINDLLESPAIPDIPAVQLGGEMLGEIGRRRIALRQFGYVLEESADASGGHGLWPRAQRLLAEHVEDPERSLSDRERSATALSTLGDWRFIEPDRSISGPWRHLIPVAKGRATIGTERIDSSQMTGGWIGPPRQVDFAEFSIGKYPVTNIEFQRFVEAGGYDDPEYWSGRFAQGWVTGDAEVLAEIREHWLSTVYEHHGKEIRDGEIDATRLEEESERRTAPRKAPYYWSDRRFNQRNQPAVGINWWEAAAFCKWATAEGHKSGALSAELVLRLPTEFEWERAVRPQDDDRIYPWGDEWDEDRAHVSSNVLNMRQPSPVGIYLESWPGSPCDAAGNVWEWTSSLFLPYEQEHDSDRFSDDSLEERVVRGSSWYNFSSLAACSVRAVDRSYNLFYDVGFRVAAVLRSALRL